jgi:hypothetical protein
MGAVLMLAFLVLIAAAFVPLRCRLSSVNRSRLGRRDTLRRGLEVGSRHDTLRGLTSTLRST